MNVSRREFIKSGSLLGTGLALSPMLLNSRCTRQEGALEAFGIQLYTLRDVLPDNPRGVLEDLASFGYKQIESYNGPSGIFWGMTHKEFSSLMNDLGMDLVSSHCDINTDFEKLAAEAGEIGIKYLLCPSVDRLDTIDGYKRICDDFNEKGRVCKENGLRFGYHNHDFDFTILDGEHPQAVMMEYTDPELVDFELDIYWIVTAGLDPVEWMNKYKGRFKLCHVKDRVKGATEREATCILGTGSIDYPTILAEANITGMEYYLVEQEQYAGTTPIDAAEANATYMKKLVF